MANKQVVEQEIAKIEERSTKRQIEAAKLLTNALSGDVRAKVMLQEGISSSDIPTVLEPAINVIFLAQYAAEPVVWNQIADEYQAENFGTIRFGDFQVDPSALTDGMGEEFIEGGLPVVGEYEEYPAVPFVTEQLDKELDKKRGIRARMSWESLRRVGNFDMIGQMTSKFAQYAARQEDIALAKLFVTTGGNVGTGFSGKGLAGNPALSLDALEAAMADSRTDKVGGNRVIAPSYKLVYGTSLAMTVRNLFAIQQIERTVGNETQILNPSFITSPFNPIEFNALDTVSGGQSDEWWFVIPELQVRPYFWEVFLQGARTPLISIKDNGHFTLAGGEVPVRDGSFDEDDIQTRIRHVVDAFVITKDGLRYSTGAGSGS
jgi:hypothetical protein